MSFLPRGSRRFLPAACLALGLAGLAGCGSEEPARKLRVAVDNVPSEIDPRYGLDQAAGRVADLILDGLLTLTPENKLAPGLAELPEVSPDGKLYTFRLRSGVRFHDDRPLTSADVAWTFRSILDPANASPKLGSLGALEEVRTTGERTIEFHLSEPDAALQVNLTASMGIVPDGMGKLAFNRKPVGTGPFQLVSQTPTQLVFERFDDYWGGKPELPGIEMHEYRSAGLRERALVENTVDLVVGDLAPAAIARFKQLDKEFRVTEGPGTKHVYLAFNCRDPVLADPDVRRAIAHAIDREELAATVWHGLVEVAEGLLPPRHWARHRDLEPIAFDHRRARELLDRAGHPDPDGLGPEPRLRLTYKTSDDSTYLTQAEELRSMLGVVGIELDIRASGFPTFMQEIEAGDFQLFGLTLLGIIDPDIYRLILHSESLPPGGLNRGRCSDPEFDEAVLLGGRSLDRDTRRQHYLRAQELIARDLPWLSLFTKKNVAVMRREVDGYVNYLGGEFLGLIPIRWAETELEESDDA